MAFDKTVHDGNRRKDASVTDHSMKNLPPNEHWQMDVGNSVFPRWSDNNPKDSFLAAKGKERPQPHIKVNECDH